MNARERGVMLLNTIGGIAVVASAFTLQMGVVAALVWPMFFPG